MGSSNGGQWSGSGGSGGSSLGNRVNYSRVGGIKEPKKVPQAANDNFSLEDFNEDYDAFSSERFAQDDESYQVAENSRSNQGNGGDGYRSKLNKVPNSWHNKDIKRFESHYNRHGADFKASSPEAYAKQANNLYKQSLVNKIPTLKYKTGEVAVYNPKTNDFGVYNNGRTITYYKPTSPTYYQRLVEKRLSEGGSIINQLLEGDNSIRTPMNNTFGGGGSISNIKPKGPDKIQN